MSRSKIVFRTIGCRANQADTSVLRRAVSTRGAEIVETLEEADVVVINTCCVTAEAERDCRKLARRALRESPNSKVIFTGCAVFGIMNFGKDIDERVITLGGGHDMHGVVEVLLAASVEQTESPAKQEKSLRLDGGRTRALLKIQNGCEHFCSYCIVPYARGPETSMPVDEVLENVDRIADEGFKELVLTGVQIGAWGKDLPGSPRIPSLLAEIADRFTPGRVRLSSIEPWSVDDALIDVIAGHDRVCPHLHVPLQSGDDRILESMGRGYTRAQFVANAEKAISSIPDLAFGTDVLCGFPGEDEAAFQNTLALLRDIPLAYLHAFPYSEREGTRAVGMTPKSDRAVSKDRVRQVRALGEEAEARFKKSQVGKVREVIIETVEGYRARGLTDNFLQISTQGEAGKLVRVKLALSDERGLQGDPV